MRIINVTPWKDSGSFGSISVAIPILDSHEAQCSGRFCEELNSALESRVDRITFSLSSLKINNIVPT